MCAGVRNAIFQSSILLLAVSEPAKLSLPFPQKANALPSTALSASSGG